jgi:hypothetical protein
MYSSAIIEASCTTRTVPLRCIDSDDAEDWLVEERIGHLDELGNFQYGPAPYQGEEADLEPDTDE